VICNEEEYTDGRARVTIDEGRVLRVDCVGSQLWLVVRTL